MQIKIAVGNQIRTADLSQPIDISIPLEEGLNTVNCFYAPPMETSPVIAGDFVGSTAMGGPLNFLNVRLNPHGNGTHTECVGHIAKERFTINKTLRQFHYLTQLVSVFPQKMDDGDRIILREQLEAAFVGNDEIKALVIRTQPNDLYKLKTNYSGANPVYMHHEAMQYVVEQGIRHLLIDLPSVDREEDGGHLLAHKAFWKYPNTVAEGREDCTISELIYVPDAVKDGLYLLNIQTASFEIDVSPSKPVLYRLF